MCFGPMRLVQPNDSDQEAIFVFNYKILSSILLMELFRFKKKSNSKKSAILQISFNQYMANYGDICRCVALKMLFFRSNDDKKFFNTIDGKMGGHKNYYGFKLFPIF